MIVYIHVYLCDLYLNVYMYYMYYWFILVMSIWFYFDSSYAFVYVDGLGLACVRCSFIIIIMGKQEHVLSIFWSIMSSCILKFPKKKEKFLGICIFPSCHYVLQKLQEEKDILDILILDRHY